MCTCSARWLTTVRCPSWSKYFSTSPVSTNRLTAGMFACFIDSTTSLSSAWLNPSTSRLYAGSPALPIPNPDLPTTSRSS